MKQTFQTKEPNKKGSINKSKVILMSLLVLGLITTTNNQAQAIGIDKNASVVIGQTDFTSGDANQGGSVGGNTLDLSVNNKKC